MQDIRPPARNYRRPEPRPVQPRPDIYTVRRSTTTVSDVVVSPQQTTIHKTTVTQVEALPVGPEVSVAGSRKPARRYAPVPEKTTTAPNARLAQTTQQARRAEPAVVVVTETTDKQDEQPKKLSFNERIKALSRRNLASGVLVAVLVIMTGYVSIDTWLTNQRVKNELSAASVPTAASDETPENRQAAEGRDEQDLPQNFLASYTVAPDAPRALYIDKINVAARVLPMGVNPDNSMQAPINIFDSGWYTGSAKPGTAGAVVINAHASGPTREGLFAYLNTLAEGDTLAVERGDGARFSYRVVYTETVALDDVDMNKVLLPHGNATEGLNLITCDGEWLQGGETFDHRTIIYTERV